MECQRIFQVGKVSLDPNNARAVGLHLVNALGLTVEDFGQNCPAYNEPIREFTTALREGRLLHGDDPVLAWAADNLVTRKNSAGLIMPAKNEAEEKIDPIVAAFMAFAQCLYGGDVGTPSISFV